MMVLKAQTRPNDKTAVKQSATQSELRNVKTLERGVHPGIIIRQAKLGPGTLAPRDVLQLQCVMGNRAVGRFLARAAQYQPVQKMENSFADPSKAQKITRSSISAPVIQRELSWVEGDRARNKNMAEPLLHFTDFGITPTIVNNIEIPGGSVTTAFLEPAFLINPLKGGGVELSVYAEPINFVGYRMELPSVPPWREQTTVGHANAALGMVAADFCISKELRPDDDAAVIVEAHGLPGDGAFARLVEEHEEYHLNELRRIIQSILVPWDRQITLCRQSRRVFVGDDENHAKKRFYAATGGTAAEIGQAFEKALRDSGNVFHHMKEGGSPMIELTTYIRGTPNVLKIYWKHPLG